MTLETAKFKFLQSVIIINDQYFRGTTFTAYVFARIKYQIIAQYRTQKMASTIPHLTSRNIANGNPIRVFDNFRLLVFNV